MKTVSENIRQAIDEIFSDITTLLENHSSIYRWNEPGSMLITAHNYAYKELNDIGKQLQSKILNDYNLLASLLSTLLYGQTKDVEKKFSAANRGIRKVVEQEHTFYKSTKDVLIAIQEDFAILSSLLNSIYDASEGSIIFVPDTNALLYNPNLVNWVFDEIPQFKLILTPTVLSELDDLKNNHRNEIVRRKSEKIINQIKEFRRRGSLTKGVPLVKNVSQIQAIATEPRIENNLPWLDFGNNDDRILASVIEIMRQYPRSVVYLVTLDINAQNKAEFAKIPFIEPPSEKIT